MESLVPLTPEWLKPHLEHGFLNLKELGLDRRETKILQEEFLKLNPYSDEFYEKKGPFQHRWSESDPKTRLSALINMKSVADESAPPFRDIGKRLKKIRTDRNWTTQQMANELFKPEGQQPFPSEVMEFKAQRISDMEYGNRKFDARFATLLRVKFDISEEWFLAGKGNPFTKTDTLTTPRITDLEVRMEKAENLIQHNIGAGMMEELLKAGNELVYKNELDGSVNMYGATNASLRIKVEEQGKEIENLKEIVKDLRDMMRGQRRDLENIYDAFSKISTDMEQNSTETIIQDEEEEKQRKRDKFVKAHTGSNPLPKPKPLP